MIPYSNSCFQIFLDKNPQHAQQTLIDEAHFDESILVIYFILFFAKKWFKIRTGFG